MFLILKLFSKNLFLLEKFKKIFLKTKIKILKKLEK